MLNGYINPEPVEQLAAGNILQVRRSPLDVEVAHGCDCEAALGDKNFVVAAGAASGNDDVPHALSDGKEIKKIRKQVQPLILTGTTEAHRRQQHLRLVE